MIKPAGVDTHVFMHAEGMTMLGGSVSYEDALSGPQAVHRRVQTEFKEHTFFCLKTREKKTLFERTPQEHSFLLFTFFN